MSYMYRCDGLGRLESVTEKASSCRFLGRCYRLLGIGHVFLEESRSHYVL